MQQSSSRFVPIQNIQFRFYFARVNDLCFMALLVVVISGNFV